MMLVAGGLGVAGFRNMANYSGERAGGGAIRGLY